MKFCSLYSGSSGNCQYIKTDNATILIDAGLSGKKIQQEIVNIGEDPKKIDAILTMFRVPELCQEDSMYLYMQTEKHGKP